MRFSRCVASSLEEDWAEQPMQRSRNNEADRLTRYTKIACLALQHCMLRDEFIIAWRGVRKSKLRKCESAKFSERGAAPAKFSRDVGPTALGRPCGLKGRSPLLASQPLIEGQTRRASLALSVPPPQHARETKRAMGTPGPRAAGPTSFPRRHYNNPRRASLALSGRGRPDPRHFLNQVSWGRATLWRQL